jgi:hypothetical protein
MSCKYVVLCLNVSIYAPASTDTGKHKLLWIMSNYASLCPNMSLCMSNYVTLCLKMSTYAQTSRYTSMTCDKSYYVPLCPIMSHYVYRLWSIMSYYVPSCPLMLMSCYVLLCPRMFLEYVILCPNMLFVVACFVVKLRN